MSSFLNGTVSFGANLSWLAPLAIQCDTINQSDFEDQTFSDQDTDLEFPNIPVSTNNENKSNYCTVSPNDILSSKDDDSAGKKKVAPRSGLQFKPGPCFECTDLFKLIFTETTNQKVFPFLNARIDRGFDFLNGEWIGYKRNYFTLVAAFEFDGFDSSIFTKEKFYTYDDNDMRANITHFALRLVSKCCEDDVPVSLVQHTAKRDRGPQFSPPIYPAISGILPSHYLIKLSANIRNENKIDQFNKLFFFNGNEEEKPVTSILSTYPEGLITTVARYERIQFSTSINQRKPSMVNRHFILLVELLGYVSKNEFFVMAATETPPLIIRGRSPSNYQISRSNSKTSLFKSKSSFMNSSASPENLDPAMQTTRRNFDNSTIQSYPIERRTNKKASIEGKDIISEISATKQLLKKKRSKYKKQSFKKEVCENSIPMSSESPEIQNVHDDEDIHIKLESEEDKLENLKTIKLGNVSDENNSNEIKFRNIDENYDTDEEIFDRDFIIPKSVDYDTESSKGFQFVTNYSDNIPTSPYINNSIDSYDASVLFNNSENIDPFSDSLKNDTTKYGFSLETNYHTCSFDEPTIMVAKSKKNKLKSTFSSKKRRKVAYLSSYSTDLDTETFDILADMLESEIRYSQSSYISEFLV